MTLAVPRSMPICRANTAENDNGRVREKVRYMVMRRPHGERSRLQSRARGRPGSPGGHVFVAELAGHGEKLDDDIEDRSRGEREKRREDGLVLKGLADRGADERRSPGDESQRPQEAPAGELRLARQGPDDPEALGRVVQREPDYQHESQPKLPARGRLADRETLGEVVETDAERDEKREPLGRPEARDGTGMELTHVCGARSESHRSARAA